MGKPFFAPQTMRLEMDMTVLAYIFAPLVITTLSNAVQVCVVRARKDGLPPGKERKVVHHLTKGIVYLTTFACSIPLYAKYTLPQLNTEPPIPLHWPFEDPRQSYSFVRLVAAWVPAVFVFEIIALPDTLGLLNWVHHLASIFCVALLSGAVPWLSENDAWLFLSQLAITMTILSTNFLLYFSMVAIHLTTSPPRKKKLMRFVLFEFFFTVFIWKLFTVITWYALKWDHYEAWATIAVTLVLEAAIFLEGVYMFYVFVSIFRKYSHQAKKPTTDESCPYVEGGCDDSSSPAAVTEVAGKREH